MRVTAPATLTARAQRAAVAAELHRSPALTRDQRFAMREQVLDAARALDHADASLAHAGAERAVAGVAALIRRAVPDLIRMGLDRLAARAA